MHESGVRCQVTPVRFIPVQVQQVSRVTGSQPVSYPSHQFVPTVRSPVGSYKSNPFRVGSHRLVASSAVPVMHPLAKIVYNRVDRSVREGGFPCGGTGFKIFSRPTGAPALPAAPRPLSTGILRKAAEMIPISYFRVVR
ncbi:hypothetical protein GCM10010371_65860 [Streptomyces subrutilus]|uniref:Uncharacterized protein n=1 Tax=Streptomyces subrutilus TaxID=36818 RepID=A0A918RHJ9_9ACTN|nr:hypothetical protein GCM10010371_65860 [Streptomyces subrutilus]